MMLAAAQNTKGKPKPAMWEGLLPVSSAPEAPLEGVDGGHSCWFDQGGGGGVAGRLLQIVEGPFSAKPIFATVG